MLEQFSWQSCTKTVVRAQLRGIRHLGVTTSKACAFASGMEAEYMADVAKQRRPVLMCVFIFDIAIYLFRLGFHGVNSAQDFKSRADTILPQIINMIALHSIVGWVNWRSRKSSNEPTRDEVRISSCCAVHCTCNSAGIYANNVACSQKLYPLSFCIKLTGCN